MFTVDTSEIYVWREGHTISLGHHFISGLVHYINTGTPCGSALDGICRGDLNQFLRHADNECLKLMPAIAGWLFNRAPSGCQGSSKAVNAWMEEGGLNGIERQKQEEDKKGKLGISSGPPRPGVNRETCRHRTCDAIGTCYDCGKNIFGL